MGKLLSINEIISDGAVSAPWYFDDAYYDNYTGQNTYRFDWPSKNFPFMQSIHGDDLAAQGVRPQIRKWIENILTETVIYDEVDKNYRIYFTKERDWHKSSLITNRWAVFYFETEESSLAFKLRFCDIVKPITDTHPIHHWEPGQ